MSSDLRPLVLTGPQIDAVFRAGPLLPAERRAFLTALAELYQGRAEIGDGELYRSIAWLLRQGHFKPPALDHEPQQLQRKVR